MEGNNVCKIYIVGAFASYLLAGGDPGFASFSARLAFDASLETARHYGGSIFPAHQGLILAPRQSPRRLNRGRPIRCHPTRVSPIQISFPLPHKNVVRKLDHFRSFCIIDYSPLIYYFIIILGNTRFNEMS